MEECEDIFWQFTSSSAIHCKIEISIYLKQKESKFQIDAAQLSTQSVT
jgi:hypothetical protein